MNRKIGYLFPVDPAWLARAQPEAVLAPSVPIIDAHQHLWHVKGPANPYLSGGSDRYLLDEYADDLASGHNVIASVYVECKSAWRSTGPASMRPVGEVEFARGMAALSASGQYGPAHVAAAIMGHADMMLGAAAQPVLEALLAASGGRLRGVRYAGAWDADPAIRGAVAGPGVYRSDAFVAAFQALARLGLRFDAGVFFPQLDDIAWLAKRFPDTQITVAHTGGLLGYGRYAGRTREVFDAWRGAMAKLAAFDNLSVKLGGLTNRLGAFDFTQLAAPPNSAELADHWRPYIETCVELFGAPRCMFESNFPVEKMGVTWLALWNAFKRITTHVSDTERDALFNGTAARVYGLGCVGGTACGTCLRLGNTA